MFLKQNILATLSYFDQIDYPLTLIELRSFLIQSILDLKTVSEKVSLEELKNCLEDLLKEGKVETKGGFYFLKGRGQIVSTRLKRITIAEEKYKKVLWAVKILSFFPFIRFIGVGNTLAYSNAKDSADLDLFIISKENHLWSSRFFATLFLKLFKLRPTANNSKNKICLSFWVTPKGMNLKSVALKPYDIYLVFWIAKLIPVYDEKKFYQNFLKTNDWVKSFIPFILSQKTPSRRFVKNKNSSIKKIVELILSFSFIENFLKKVQLKFMNDKIKKTADLGTEVVLSDHMLKFHVDDTREIVRENFEKKYHSLL